MKYVPQILELIVSVVGSIGKAIVDNLPMIVAAVSQIIFTILNGLISALPQIADGALQLVLALVDGIIEHLPMLTDVALKVIETLPEIIKVIVSFILGAIPEIIDAGIQLLTSLVAAHIVTAAIITRYIGRSLFYYIKRSFIFKVYR